MVVVVVAVVTVVTVVTVMVGTVGGYSNIDTVAGAEVMDTVEVGHAYARDGVCFVGGGGDFPRGDAEAGHDDDHGRYHSLSKRKYFQHRIEGEFDQGR